MLGIALRPVRKGIREGCLEVTVRKEVRADTDRDGQSGVKTRDGQRTRKLSLEAILPEGRELSLFSTGVCPGCR